jgi:hypothetical protein
MHFWFRSPSHTVNNIVRLKHSSPNAFKRIFSSSHLRSEIHHHHQSLEKPNKHHFHCSLQKDFKYSDFRRLANTHFEWSLRLLHNLNGFLFDTIVSQSFWKSHNLLRNKKVWNCKQRKIKWKSLYWRLLWKWDWKW